MKRGFIIIMALWVCVVSASGNQEPACKSKHLLEVFRDKQSNLVALVDMIRQDHGSINYIGGGLVKSSAGEVSPHRKRQYLDVAKEIGAFTITQDGGDVIAWICGNDAKTIAGYSRTYGVAYISDKGRYNYQCIDSIDSVGDKANDGVWISPIGNNWYIICMITNA